MNQTPQRTRVLLLLNDLRMGGSERQALWLAGALRGMGLDSAIMGFCPAGPVNERCVEAGIPCYAVPLAYPWSPWYTPLYLLRAAGALRRRAPDLLLPFTSIPNAYACLLRRFAGASACVWNQRDEGIGRPLRWMESAAVARASGFVANSSDCARFLTSVLEVPAERVAVVPNAVTAPSTGAPAGTWRRQCGIPDGAAVACMVGNVRPPKDHATLLRAWRIALDRASAGAPPLHLLLVGREDFPAPLESLVRDLNLERAVHRLGAQSDVAGILADCDFACFSSQSEGLPNAVLEAMAAGLPVAATDLPSLREAMPAGQRHLLAPRNDAEALARSILALASDRAGAREIGRANRSHVLASFAPDRILSMYLGALRRFGVDLAARPS